MKTEKNAFQQLVDHHLSGLQWDAQHTDQVLRILEPEGGLVVKKKLSVGLVLAMILILTASVALAVTSILYSPATDALKQAQTVLADKYGLTNEMLGLFSSDTHLKKDETVVVFFTNIKDEKIAQAIGEYTVTLREDEAIAAWTHDDADRMTWQAGDLESSVWGAAQLENYLCSEEQATDTCFQMAKPTPDPGTIDRTNWFVKTEVEPGPNDLSKEAAVAMVKAALLDAYDLTERDLAAAVEFDCKLEEDSQNGLRAWESTVQLAYQEYSCVYFVAIDAATGAVLQCNVTTIN